MLEYVTLYNLLGMHQKAYDTIMNHRFRAWEGAEGRISGQYKIALTEMAKEEIVKKNFKAAKELLEKALLYPVDLGEGRLEGIKYNNIYYYLGVVEAELGEAERSEECFKNAALAKVDLTRQELCVLRPAGRYDSL